MINLQYINNRNYNIFNSKFIIMPSIFIFSSIYNILKLSYDQQKKSIRSTYNIEYKINNLDDNDDNGCIWF